MSYRKLTRMLEAGDGTRLAVHTHLASVSSEEVVARRPAVLLTNGMGTTENFWRYLVRDLERDFRVVHWDYRGHGQSSLAVSGDYSLRTQGDDLARVTAWVMESSPAPPVHVGFSMGVPVVLELFRAQPQRVRAMALIAGAPEAPFTGVGPFALPGVMDGLRFLLKALQPLVPTVGPWVQRVLRSPLTFPAARALGILRPGAPREDIDQFLTSLAQMDAPAYFATIRAVFDADTSDVLPRIDVPTLIVTASKDTMMPPSQVRRFAAAVPCARHVELRDAGHAGLLEAGDVVRAEVRALVEQVAG